PLFRGQSLAALTFQIVNSATPSLRALIPHLPPHWEAALSRALAKQPAQRFPSVSAFAEALAADAGATTIIERRRRLLGARARVAGVLAAGVALSGGLWLLTQRPPQHVPPAPSHIASVPPEKPIATTPPNVTPTLAPTELPTLISIMTGWN